MNNTYAFDFKKGEFIFENGTAAVLTGKRALQLWVEKIIRTQQGRYVMYNGTMYGANVEDLVIGKNYTYGFTQAELKREIENAILQHDDINNMRDFKIIKTGSKIEISFTLNTNYGDVTEEITYDG